MTVSYKASAVYKLIMVISLFNSTKSQFSFLDRKWWRRKISSNTSIYVRWSKIE